MNKKALIGGIIFIGIGLVISIASFLPKNSERVTDTNNWNRLSAGAGKEAEGVAVNSEYIARTEGARKSREINSYYCPVYEFKVSDVTRQVTAVGDDCKETKDAVVLGSTATVIYDESDPTIAFVNSEATKTFYKDGEGSQIAGMVLGAVMVVIGLIVAFAARPKSPEKIAEATERKRKADEEFARLMAEAEAKNQK